ncbi:hypothetical protein GYM62_14865 [Algoriphagus sp. NBT04N3]|jgi:hypothetical protein|uniref:hypothetical protein n=1 Tax=Algoriphagus sp. NBT04N3 TaxID=2705473 RepID=UPI001C633D75|nr:hypothetical protein [Algoriphagus sp. NBT04N3]QYH40006.1 hypothetical protein GYM62_14865 [Algoriphagus sp. NBT04N3]
MEREALTQLNDAIASLHAAGDVFSYEIDRARRIKFPRGFLRTFDSYRRHFDFIEDDVMKEKIVMHMLHRDTLHWLWLKTDIIAHARMMVIKFQLVNLASILEGIVKHLVPRMPQKKDNVYDRIDLLAKDGLIENPKDLKELWAARNSIHLHLDKVDSNLEFSDQNYIFWHSSLSKMIQDLNVFFSS